MESPPNEEKLIASHDAESRVYLQCPSCDSYVWAPVDWSPGLIIQCYVCLDLFDMPVVQYESEREPELEQLEEPKEEEEQALVAAAAAAAAAAVEAEAESEAATTKDEETEDAQYLVKSESLASEYPGEYRQENVSFQNHSEDMAAGQQVKVEGAVVEMPASSQTSELSEMELVDDRQAQVAGALEQFQDASSRCAVWPPAPVAFAGLPAFSSFTHSALTRRGDKWIAVMDLPLNEPHYSRRWAAPEPSFTLFFRRRRGIKKQKRNKHRKKARASSSSTTLDPVPARCPIWQSSLYESDEAFAYLMHPDRPRIDVQRIKAHRDIVKVNDQIHRPWRMWTQKVPRIDPNRVDAAMSQRAFRDNWLVPNRKFVFLPRSLRRFTFRAASGLFSSGFRCGMPRYEIQPSHLDVAPGGWAHQAGIAFKRLDDVMYMYANALCVAGHKSSNTSASGSSQDPFSAGMSPGQAANASLLSNVSIPAGFDFQDEYDDSELQGDLYLMYSGEEEEEEEDDDDDNDDDEDNSDSEYQSSRRSSKNRSRSIKKRSRSGSSARDLRPISKGVYTGRPTKTKKANRPMCNVCRTQRVSRAQGCGSGMVCLHCCRNKLAQSGAVSCGVHKATKRSSSRPRSSRRRDRLRKPSQIKAEGGSSSAGIHLGSIPEEDDDGGSSVGTGFSGRSSGRSAYTKRSVRGKYNKSGRPMCSICRSTRVARAAGCGNGMVCLGCCRDMLAQSGASSCGIHKAVKRSRSRGRERSGSRQREQLRTSSQVQRSSASSSRVAPAEPDEGSSSEDILGSTPAGSLLLSPSTLMAAAAAATSAGLFGSPASAAPIGHSAPIDGPHRASPAHALPDSRHPVHELSRSQSPSTTNNSPSPPKRMCQFCRIDPVSPPGGCENGNVCGPCCQYLSSRRGKSCNLHNVSNKKMKFG